MLQLTSLDLNRGREEWNSFQSGVSLILCGFGLSPKASFVSKGRGLEKKQEPSQKLANRSFATEEQMQILKHQRGKGKKRGRRRSEIKDTVRGGKM